MASVGAVLVTWPDFDMSPGGPGQMLVAAGLEVRLAPKLGRREPAELSRLLAGARGALVSTDPFTAEVIAAQPQLQVIARVGVGSDSVDLPAATASGIRVTITPGANDPAVADHTLALVLAALRRIPEHDAMLRRGEWNRTGVYLPRQLSGLTVGLVGLGRIGRQVARRLQAFGTTVIGHDPEVAEAEGIRLVGLDELLATSDVVSLHCPLVAATHHLIGAPELRLMKPDALLVNTSRGEVVDQAALVAALRAGTIAAAALDVFEGEPPTGSPLLTLPNVVLTPHLAGLSTTSVAEMTARAATSVVDVVQGREPADLANPSVSTHPLRRFPS
jgi:phosphoglycerate dehydrogenase-like enzyme